MLLNPSSPPLSFNFNTASSSTTSITLTHATFEPSLSKSNTLKNKSGILIKPALKLNRHSFPSSKSVRFPTQLCRVRSFDKSLCTLSINGISPLKIEPLNFINGQPSELNFNQVTLEKVELANDEKRIQGFVKVVNIAFQKHIIVRYTLDNWNTFHHVDALHVKSITEYCDQFIFYINIPDNMLTSEDANIKYNLKFAIQYNTNGQEFWDNNQGRNYNLEINPRIKTDISKLDETLKINIEPENNKLKEIAEPIDFSTHKITSRTGLGDRYSIAKSLKDTLPSSPISIKKPNNFTNSIISINESFFGSPTQPPSYSSNSGLTTQTVTAYTSGLLMGSPVSSFLGCSPNSYTGLGFAWAKAGSSWFDNIRIDSLATR